MKNKVWESILWKILSCGCFAGINVLVRYLTGGSPLPISKPLPVYMIMLLQNLIGAIILTMYLKRNVKITTDQPGLQTIRIVTAALGIGLWYLSLRFIPVTQVVALSFIAPMITVIAGVLFLRESLNWQRSLAILLSISGGFLITRPDKALLTADSYNWYMLLPLIAAFVFALDKVFTRKLLLAKESSLTTAWYLLAFTSPLCALPIFVYGWISPDLTHLPWLLLLGVLGALAHYTFNRAYALSDITFLLPFGAAKILLCTLLSYMAFLEIPNTFDLWLGVTILTLSTVVLTIPSKPLIKTQAIQVT